MGWSWEGLAFDMLEVMGRCGEMDAAIHCSIAPRHQSHWISSVCHRESKSVGSTRCGYVTLAMVGWKEMSTVSVTRPAFGHGVGAFEMDAATHLHRTMTNP